VKEQPAPSLAYNTMGDIPNALVDHLVEFERVEMLQVAFAVVEQPSSALATSVEKMYRA
jgi:hypothetical protein